MRLKQFLILILLFNPFFSFSQVIDSLINLLDKTATEYEKVDLWNEISNQQQPIGGKEAAENALKLAKSIKYSKGEADANYYLGSYHYLKGNATLTKTHVLKAIVLYDSLGLLSAKAETLIFLGEISYFDEEYAIALKYLQEAENIAIQIKNKIILAQSYETKALIYIDGLADKKLGELYLLKSTAILAKTNRLNLLVQNYTRLATFYIENNNVDSSLLFIKKGEIILNRLDNSASNISIYLQYSLLALKGTCYTRTGKVDTAKLFIEQSLPFFIKNKNWYDVAWSYTDLSTIALKKGIYKEAVSYAKESIELDLTASLLEKNTKLIRDAFRHLDQDSFHVYNEKYIMLLGHTKKATHINEIQTSIKEEALDKKEKELTKEKNISRYIIFSLLLLSLLYALSLFFYNQKLKDKKRDANAQEIGESDIVSQINETEIDKLRKKVTTIERNLLSKEIDLERQQSSIDNTTQYLREIVTKDNPIELKKSIQKLAHQLEHNKNNKNQWAFFSQQFEQIHPNFFSNLKKYAPNLSIRELRLCAYSRLDMTNQEVAQILGIATSSVGKARHRLKKKMNLDKAQDLNQFLADL